MQFSIIIPAYNEEENIVDTVEEIFQSIQIEELDKLIIVDDGSDDSTYEKSLELSGRYEKVVPIRQEHKGKAIAIFKGIENCNSVFCVMIDADGQYDPRDIQKLMEYSEYDLILGVRKHRKDPIMRKAFSRTFNFLVRVLFNIPVHDVNCGLKAFKREILNEINLYSDFWLVFDTQLIYETKKKGYRFCEVPIGHRERRKGSSKIGSVTSPLKTFFELLKYRLRSL